MINYEVALKKSQKKVQNRYGISIVSFINHELIIKEIRDLRTYINTSVSKDAFIWTPIEKLHVTLYRCASTPVDITYSAELIDYISNSLQKLHELEAELDIISLDEDGILRLHIKRIIDLPMDVDTLHSLSGLKYREIYEPWITIAYLNPIWLQANRQNLKFTYENKILEGICINLTPISIVKFNNTSFENTITLKDIKLE